jgi:hypothetical protein
VWQVSEAGGIQPKWSADGSRLYFLTAGRLMTVSVTLQPTLRLGPPRELFDDGTIAYYVPTNNPNEFLAIRRVRTGERPPALTVWLNWTASLEKKPSVRN